MNRSISAVAAVLWTLVSGAAALAQPRVSPAYDPQQWLHRDAEVALVVEGVPKGRLAVFLGSTDVTDLFRRRGGRWTYRSELLKIPAGEGEWVVWEASSSGWREVARIPLRVLRRGGFEERELGLRVDLQGLTDLSSGGGQPPPEEERLTAQLDLQQRASRRGWNLRLAANLVGVSEVEQALRFGEAGEEADRLDLSSWGLEVARGEAELTLGHLSFGDSRQLIQAFSSRGARLRLPVGGAADLSVTAMNGSTVVGWDNFLGLARTEHQVLAGTLGLELMPATPGALRLEGTFLDGSLQPLSGFNQQQVTDREESEGWSARIQAATPSQRLRLDAAVALSRFTNPGDPLLAQGEDLVAVEPESREARYADLSWALLRRPAPADRPGGHPLEIALELRHQRVEPLYRTVAAFLQADREETGGDLRLGWGGLLAQLSYSAARDNLDELPSVLTTRTRQGSWTFNLPLAQWAAGEASPPWLPVFSVNGQRIHQQGDGIPADGGFSESHVPDQVSWNHQAQLHWSGGAWSLGATGWWSEQDNRQPGREGADFQQRGLGLTLATTPLQRLDLGLDLRREVQQSLGSGEETTTRAAGLNFSLRLPARHGVSGSLSWSSSRTDPDLRESEDLLGDARYAWSFEGRRRDHGWNGQLYLRWAYQRSEAMDFLFAFDDRRTGWKLTGGLTMSLF